MQYLIIIQPIFRTETRTQKSPIRQLPLSNYKNMKVRNEHLKRTNSENSTIHKSMNFVQSCVFSVQTESNAYYHNLKEEKYDFRLSFKFSRHQEND